MSSSVVAGRVHVGANVEVIAKRKGRVVQHYVGHNLTLARGIQYILDRVTGADATHDLTRIGLGSSSQGVQSSDTWGISPLAVDTWTVKAQGGNSWRFLYELDETEQNGVTFCETWLPLGPDSSDGAFARFVFPAIRKTRDIQLYILWTVTLERAA